MERGAQRIRQALAALALGLAPAPPVAARDFETALGLVREGEAAAAVAIFRDLAQSGNRAAQVNLAVLHARGWGVPLDEIEAGYWAWRARLMGEPRAIAPSDFLLTGLPSEARNVLADRLSRDLQTVARTGEPQAFMALGRVETEIRKPAAPEAAALWFTLAAAFEVRYARYLRDLTLSGLPVEEQLSIQASARRAYDSWCSRIPAERRPASCAPT